MKRVLKSIAVFAVIGLAIAVMEITASAPKADAHRPIEPAAFWPLTAADRDTVERVVMAEARGECFEGMKAVAQTILNRLQHPRFPATVREVIREYARPFAGTVSQAVRQAVREVFDEGDCVIEGSILYFMNAATASARGARWQYENTEHIITIGRHQFRR